MTRLALLAALAASVVLAAPAAASPTDTIPLFRDAAGVTLVEEDGQLEMRFAPRAAAVYRRFAGRRVDAGCSELPTGSVSGGTFSRGSTELRAPRKRSTLRLGMEPGENDVCFVLAARREADRSCVPPEPDERKRCLVAIAPVTTQGRDYLVQAKAELDVSVLFLTATSVFGGKNAPTVARMRKVFRDEVVALATPDDTPPAGKAGYWSAGPEFAIVVVDGTGRRVFASLRGADPVFSTNVLSLAGSASPTFI